MTRRAAVIAPLALALLAAPPWQTPAVEAQESPTPLAAALSLYRQNDLWGALDFFAEAVRQDSSNTDALAYLAETRRRLGDASGSIRLARAALRRAPCSSFAHFVLAAAYNPQYRSMEETSADSTWSHALAAVACHSSDGNAWLICW